MVGGLHDLTPAERERVSAAVSAAQARTHARFALVVVHASDRYHLYPIVWGATVALIVFGIAAIFAPGMGLRPAFAGIAAVFVLVSLVLEWTPLRLRVVPRRARHAHAHALAHREFAARILSHPEHKGGVLFFVSLAERYAEIMADHALHEAAGQAALDKIIADFTACAKRGDIAAGFVAGADACGALLEAHHPRA